MNDRDSLDDVIDRAVRDMTNVAADDRAVARVMARVRAADARDVRAAIGERWMLTPRIAWCGLIAVLLMVFLGRSWYPLRHQPEGQRAAATAPQSTPAQSEPQLEQPPTVSPLTVRESPTRVAAAASTNRTAASAQEPPPFESDIVIASITPAPLADAAAILVEPLAASLLTVDEIPVASIDVPPVSPEQK